jgi:tetratricopeptide (TPR) repeat protein
MPEPVSYPGSPSLSAEAREKVLQTFRHTLEMARTGRNEDALLGCDFILKMDARFAPARRLLSSLRGVAAGTVVDLGEFEAFGGPPAPAQPAAVPAPPASGPPTPAAGYAVPAAPPPPAPSAAGLDDLSFDDLSANPFASSPSMPPAPAAPPPAPAPPAPVLPSPSDFGFGTTGPDPFASPVPDLSFSPGAPGVESAFPTAAPDPFAAVPSFGAPAGAPDPFGAAAPPADPFAAPSAPSFPAPVPGPAPAAGVDPRIAQFLKQGDDASARGQLQEAIDLWSRVFLIDLSNEEASRRIDAARERQNESARQLDTLLSEGVQLYEAGDLQSARNAFLKVLTISEADATARNYLNQIDVALAVPSGAPARPGAGALPDEPYLRDELESPVRPSFADDYPLSESPHADGGLEDAAIGAGRPEVAPKARGGKIDGRLLLGVAALVLVGVAAAAWFVFKPKASAPPPVADAPPVAAAPAQDPLEKAQALFKQGKVEEALGILTAIPSTDPRHDQALVLIDQFKSSAEPRPSAATGPSDAQVDEARVAGLASLSSGRYIEAVKSLDVVVRARPEDGEAAQALARARDSVSALGSAIRSYNEQDYESAERLLWDLRKQDPKNQDVEEYLFKSYFNDGILALQSGSTKKAADAFKEAASLRPRDAETQRHLKFARRYAGGTDDLLARIYVRHVSPRP